MTEDGVNFRAQKREPVQVAAGLIVREGRYLVTRRKPDVHLGGLWEFPGGKREARESLEACLRRELREELGIEVTRPEPFQVIQHEYADHAVELHFFRCTIAGGELRSLDCDDLRWVGTHELRQLPFPPADRALIEALQDEAPG